MRRRVPVVPFAAARAHLVPMQITLRQTSPALRSFVRNKMAKHCLCLARRLSRSKVIDSRMVQGERVRRRQCVDCSGTFYSREVVDPAAQQAFRSFYRKRNKEYNLASD